MKKSELRAGMIVRNKVSGSVGEVLGDEKGRLWGPSYCVLVRMRTKSGKNEGKYKYPFWRVRNLEIV